MLQENKYENSIIASTDTQKDNPLARTMHIPIPSKGVTYSDDG